MLHHICWGNHIFCRWKYMSGSAITRKIRWVLTTTHHYSFWISMIQDVSQSPTMNHSSNYHQITKNHHEVSMNYQKINMKFALNRSFLVSNPKNMKVTWNSYSQNILCAPCRVYLPTFTLEITQFDRYIFQHHRFASRYLEKQKTIICR